MPWKSKLHRCMFYWGEVPGPQGFHWKILQQILFDHLHCSRYMVFKRHGCCQNRQNSLASWILHPAGMKCKCIYLWRSDFYCDIWSLQGFPGGSDSKESACNVGDSSSIPGWRSSPGEGNGNPLQYYCLEHPMDRGAWWGRRVRQDWTTNTFTFGHYMVLMLKKILMKPDPQSLSFYRVEKEHKEGKRFNQAWSPGRGDKWEAVSQELVLVPFKLQTNNPKLNHTKITGPCKAIKTDNILNSEFYEVPGKSITCSSPTNDCVYRLQINSSSISPIWQHPLKALFFLWTIYLLYKKLVIPREEHLSCIYEYQILLSDILSLYGRFISCGIITFNKITMKHETHTDGVLHFLRITNLWKGHRIHCYHCYHLLCLKRFFSDRHGHYAYRHKRVPFRSFCKIWESHRDVTYIHSPETI